MYVLCGRVPNVKMLKSSIILCVTRVNGKETTNHMHDIRKYERQILLELTLCVELMEDCMKRDVTIANF